MVVVISCFRFLAMKMRCILEQNTPFDFAPINLTDKSNQSLRCTASRPQVSQSYESMLEDGYFFLFDIFTSKYVHS